MIQPVAAEEHRASMTREVSRENSQAAEDKDPKAARPDKRTNAPPPRDEGDLF